MNRTPKFQTLSGRRVALWDLATILALLLVVSAGAPFGHAQDRQGSQGAEVRGSREAEAQTGEGAGEKFAIRNLSTTLKTSPKSEITITYTYDDAGRLAQANYGGISIAYTYDAAGNLVGVSPGGRRVYLPLIMR